MADNLRITTPLTGTENLNKPKLQRDQPSPVEIIDPGKVSSRNENSQPELKNTLENAFNSNSVFQRFVDRLQKTPDLSETLQKLLFSVAGEGLKGFSALPSQKVFAELMDAMIMDKSDMFHNLLFQQQTATKFGGELFQVLRALTAQDDSPQLTELLGRFLKSYDAFFSSKDTMQSLMQQFEGFLQTIPRSYREPIANELSKLIFLGAEKELAKEIAKFLQTDAGKAAMKNPESPFFAGKESATSRNTNNPQNMGRAPEQGAPPERGAAAQAGTFRELPTGEQSRTEQVIAYNLQVIKEEVLPAVGKYFKMTNDFGLSRDKIALLVNDLARMNVGSREEVFENFQSLMDFCRMKMQLPGELTGGLSRMLQKRMATPDAEGNSFLDALAKVLTPSSSRQLSNVSQTMLKDTLSALLMDQSVYMPFQHMILPAQYQGAFLFSEIWVDKDSGGVTPDGQALPKRLFLSFEIKDLGSFQAVVLLTGNKVDFQIQVPPSLSGKNNAIQKEITAIFSRSGFETGQIGAGARVPETDLQLIRKVAERRRSVDVTV